jgi:hypothetical protein
MVVGENTNNGLETQESNEGIATKKFARRISGLIKKALRNFHGAALSSEHAGI